MSDNTPIGVFDSGIGGLSVLQRIREQLPNEELLYVADSAHIPYGDKPRAFIEKRAILLTQFLIRQKAKAVVVACNTATAAAIATLRTMFSTPFIGIEPGVKPALALTHCGVVGILATTETLKSQKFADLICRFRDEFKFVLQECPGLAQQVEQLDLAGPKTRALVERYVCALLEKGADTIVLGCTHYPFICPLIEEIAGKTVRIVDTGTAVAKEVSRRLGEAGLLAGDDRVGSERFWTTGDPERLQRVLDCLWDKPARVSALPEEEGETK